jgi:hypothetical protein
MLAVLTVAGQAARTAGATKNVLAMAKTHQRSRFARFRGRSTGVSR